MKKLMQACPAILGLILVSMTFEVMADVVARVDRTQLVEGETVTLVLQTDNPEQNLNADFSVLEADFLILDQRSESQMSIVNGRQAATIRLLVTLEPKRAGQVVIPSFTLGESRTSPIRIEVDAAPQPEPGEMPPVFIEMELEPADGPFYVHAQMALTVRIFYQQNLTEAAINPPSPQQAAVRLLDEVPYQSTRNDVRYRVLERRYAVFPERSGELVIPPLTLTGRLIERAAERLWQPAVRGRRVHVDSEPLTIQVLPKPDDYAGEHWLPARRITLSQQISNTDRLEVGEPVTRTVILDAVGLEENMIEEPTWPDLANARIYPDQPQGISRDDGQWVLGHKEFRYAVVPEQAGELVLPEIRLDWWDTATGTAQTAVLPEHRIPVNASSLVTDIVAPLTATGLAGSDPGHPVPVDSAALARWRLAALVLGGLWILTTVLYLRKGPAVPEDAPEGRVDRDEKELLSAIRKACRDQDSAGARRVLGQWVRKYGPAWAHGSLMEFARQLDDEALSAEIYGFDASEFGTGGQSAWQGSKLWDHFSAWIDARDRGPSDRTLHSPDLYARAR